VEGLGLDAWGRVDWCDVSLGPGSGG